MDDVDDWQHNDVHGLAKTPTEIKLDLLKRALEDSLFANTDKKVEIYDQLQKKWPED